MTASPADESHRRTVQFERDWWQLDTGVDEEERRKPGLRAHLAASGRRPITTADVYAEGNGQWSAARAAQIHNPVAESMLGDPSPAPQAFFTIGCMGAGKTSVLRPLVESARILRGSAGRMSRIAADEVRIILPEYHDGAGSRVVQDEAFTITYDIVFPAALTRRADIVYDTIGRVLPSGKISFSWQLEQLRAAGYQLEVLLAVAPLGVCVDRAAQRAVTGDGRYVDPAVQAQQYDQPATVLRLVEDQGLCDDWVEVDTSPAREPVLVQGSAWWRDNFAEVVRGATFDSRPE